MTTLSANIRDGRIEPLEPLNLPEGTPVVVTAMVDKEGEFWNEVTRPSLDAIWDDPAEDVYADFLQK